MRAKDAATFLLEANKAASALKPADTASTPADTRERSGTAPEHTSHESELMLAARVVGERKEEDVVGCGLLCGGAAPLGGVVSVEV